jgi:ATP-grasp domain
VRGGGARFGALGQRRPGRRRRGTGRDTIATVGADVAVDQVLVLYDQPAGVDGWSAQSWANVREGIGLRHKTEAGALALDVADEPTLRREYRRLPAGGAVLVEAMAAGAVELLVAARRDAVVPALVIGLGGTWAELLDDAVVVPLPARAERIADAIRALRGAPLLCGGRGRPPLDVDAAARLAAAAGAALLADGLELVELNPVLVAREGALAVDAVVREGARAVAEVAA